MAKYYGHLPADLKSSGRQYYYRFEPSSSPLLRKAILLFCWTSTFLIIRLQGQVLLHKYYFLDKTILQIEIDNPPMQAPRNTISNISTTKRSYCTREQLRNGSWEHVRLKAPPYISRTSHLRCYPLPFYYKGFWDTYDWVPSSGCSFQQWKKKEFCSLLKRATVLIIGDSLSWEHYSSLSQLLGLKIRQNMQHESKLYQRNVVKLACNQTVRLAFRRDDLLTNISVAIEETFPQVLVINRGAHFINDTRFVPALRRNLEEINDWYGKCHGMNMTCHLFWRSTVPGHPRCNQMNFTEPVNNIEEMESWIANHSNYNNRSINYHWYDYRYQNEIAMNMLESELLFKFDVIDAYELNIRRPDEHRAHESDCLHNCYPGKMDVYSRMLLHFLKYRRTQEDADYLEERFQRAMDRLAAPRRDS